MIDHLCEIIKVEDENNTETNFQKVKPFGFVLFFQTLLRLLRIPTKKNLFEEMFVFVHGRQAALLKLELRFTQ